MTLPDSLNTVSSLLTLIDYSIRFAKFLSPPLRRALSETQKYLSKIESSTNEITVSEALVAALQNHVRKPEIEASSLDILLIFDAVQASLANSSLTLCTDSIPRYGDIINNLLQYIAEKTKHWGCFERWGVGYINSDGVHLPSVGKLLPAKDFTLMLRKTHAVGKVSRLDQRKSQLYFVNELLPKMDDLWVAYLEPPKDHNLDFGYSGKTRLSFSSREAIVKWESPRALIISLKLGIGNYNHDESYQVPLSAMDFEFLYSGMLNDLVRYAQLVRKENKQTHTFIQKLRHIAKKQK